MEQMLTETHQKILSLTGISNAPRGLGMVQVYRQSPSRLQLLHLPGFYISITAHIAILVLPFSAVTRGTVLLIRKHSAQHATILH